MEKYTNEFLAEAYKLSTAANYGIEDMSITYHAVKSKGGDYENIKKALDGLVQV